MSKSLIGTISIFAVLVLGTLSLAGMYVSYNRAEVHARNACEAQVGNVENVLDNMWKNFQEIGGIADRERETAMDLFVEYAEARTPEGAGKLMSWITEQNPTIDASIYKDLQARLTAGRQEFRNAQTFMLELKRAHEDIIEDPWQGMFVRNTEPFAYNVISSEDTEEAMATGRDDRVFTLPSND